MQTKQTDFRLIPLNLSIKTVCFTATFAGPETQITYHHTVRIQNLAISSSLYHKERLPDPVLFQRLVHIRRDHNDGLLLIIVSRN
jgi:hypothetical protein